MAAVEVENLTITYGDLVAVDDLSLTAEGGEVLALLGPNGAGKTSTVECLVGLRRPFEGRVAVLGSDPVADRRSLMPRLGAMLQDGGLNRAMRVSEAIELFGAFYDDPLDPVALLERVDLTERRSSTWRQLSGGEQQRLSLALAVIGRPEVVLLDEPAAGVDVDGRDAIRSLIRDLRAQGVCVLLTTHDLGEAERIADRVAIIDRGRLVAVGTPDELAAATEDEIRFGAAPGIDVAALALRLGVAVEERTPGMYHIAASGSPRLIATLTAWLAEQNLALGDLHAGRKPLEDVFRRLTGREEPA